MISIEYCVLMARYNQWMNRKLYQACEGLGEAQRKQDVGAFFGPIQGTLNHLLYGDTVWMRRFTGRPTAGLHGRMEFHPDFAALRAMRDVFDSGDRRLGSKAGADLAGRGLHLYATVRE